MAGPFDNLLGQSYEPSGDMSPVAERVFQLQSQVASTRTQPIDPGLAALLSAVGSELDVYFEVTSGGQPKKGSSGKRTGSTRHDEGRAADLKAYTLSGGKKVYLDHTSTAGQKAWGDIVRLSVAGGATGIGAGKDYMGGQTVHIGYGGKGTWGAGGRGANSPEWLREAFDLGTKTPPLSIPQVGSLTDTASALAPVPQRKSAALDAITSATGGRVASPGIPSAYDSPKTPQQVASLYEGIYPQKRPGAQVPTLFGDVVGTPDSMIPPDDATYSGANRMGIGGMGALLGGRSIPPGMPNPMQARPSSFPARPSVIPPNTRQAVPSVPSSFPARPGVIPSNGRPAPSVGGVGGAGIAGQVQLPRNVVPASVQRDMAAINAIPKVPMPMSGRDPTGAMPTWAELLAMASGGKAPLPAPSAQMFLARNRNMPSPASYGQMQQARSRQAPMPMPRRTSMFAPVPATRSSQMVAPQPMYRPSTLDIISSGGGGEDFNNQGSGFYSLSSSV